MLPEKRLLIIDDEEMLRAILKEYLEECGLRVFAYESMPDLEKELEEKRPHAVLLDIVLPRISGIEILRMIKKIDRRIPVIMMTGYADESERLESLRSGAYALLTKPFKNLEELFHIVNNCMEHFIETLKTEQLTQEVEERYRREKMNALELDFLKNLQHMIGETEDPLFVLKNANTLLKNFLDFDFFGALLTNDEEIAVQIFSGMEEDPALVSTMASVLVRKIPKGQIKPGQRILIQGVAREEIGPDVTDIETVVVELSTANRSYGYAALYRQKPFDAPEWSIFTRFCSHITLTLEKISLFNEVKTLSIHDGLTGVHNHAYIVGVLDAEVERSRRYNTTFSVILFDVDDFKLINDEYGHLAGDQALRSITQVMKESLRTIDKIGRYGGEEFLLILPETDLDKAAIVAERLRKAVETAGLRLEDKSVRISVSGGIATYTPGIESKKIIKIADDNLYRAKKEGKNRIYYENI